MKAILRHRHQGRSGLVAVLAFLFAYTATVALVIAPEQVKSAIDAPWTWTLD